MQHTLFLALHPGCEIWNLMLKIKSATYNFQNYDSGNAKFNIHNSKFQFQDAKCIRQNTKIKNSKSKIWNPKAKIKHSTSKTHNSKIKIHTRSFSCRHKLFFWDSLPPWMAQMIVPTLPFDLKTLKSQYNYFGVMYHGEVASPAAQRKLFVTAVLRHNRLR